MYSGDQFRDFRDTGPDSHLQTYWTNISYAFQLIIVVFAIIPPGLIPGAIYIDADPFAYTFHRFLLQDHPKSSNFSKFIVLALRIIISTICVIEACRFYSLFFPLGAHWLELQLCILYQFKKLKLLTKSNHLTFQKWYTVLQITSNMAQNSLDFFLGNLMAAGFAILVICNAISLKAHGLVPWFIYWIFPTTSLIACFLVWWLLSLITQLDTQSRRIIGKGKRAYNVLLLNDVKVLSRECKYVLRRYKTLQPIGISCGSFYKMKQGSDAEFFYWAIFRTVDVLLMKF